MPFLALTALVVRDYDEALAFYVGTLGCELVEDTYVPEQDKRWVVVSPPGATESRLLLARAATPEQESRIGNQSGGRVFLFLFLYTDDFERDYALQGEGRGVREGAEAGALRQGGGVPGPLRQPVGPAAAEGGLKAGLEP